MADISSWDAHDPAVWAEEVGSPPIAISLRHPSYPAEATCAANPGALRKVVAKYLGKVSNRLGLPDLFAAEDNFKVFMGWLGLPGDDGGVDPRKSFWVTRYEDPINRMGLIDQSVVFVAAESWRENDSAGVLGSRLGLRVIAHVAQQGSAIWKVRITSVARSIGLPEALESHATLTAEANNFYAFVFNPANFLSFKAFITSATGLDSDRIAIEGVRVSTVGGSTSGTIYATESRRDEDPPGPGYALTLRFAIPPGTLFSKPTVERSALVAHAAQVKADLFTQDPASRAGLGKLIESRPNRSPERLNAFKYLNVELEGLHFDFGNHCLLIDDDLELADVRQSKIVTAAANPDLTQGVVPADVDHPGQNEFAALGGYEHTRAKFNQRHLRPLFTTLIAYGLPPNDYFRFATNPLRIRYRSPITPGPGKDGKTVNAQVDFDPPRSSLIAEPNEWTEEERRPMHVRFALADLKRSASRRQPLGLAADPRWSWHEYCHVLLAAQTGKLELHFAHSAGDALAAILSDPRSALATHPWSRGYTFPWVYLHRRHDRAVNRGWGWTGPRHRQERFPATDCNCRHKGYDSEQILATSLFTLYRSLGGDTVEANSDPDRLPRERAADYTAYLILKTISLMPPASFGAMQTPDQFATGLIDVDTGTLPVTTGPLKDRVGGWAQKVVRWAFEAQGLYAANPLVVLNEPGLPPPVDVFIDDNRPSSEGTYTRGGYMPVSLDWSEPGPRPWHAAANAISIAGNRITVEVRNRGRNVANGVTVSVWYIVRSAGATTPPNWKATTWTKIGESNPMAVPPWPAPAVAFPSFAAPPAQPAGKRVWILAIADCAADRANTNPATSYPCSTKAVSIVDLVAGDNNLGLRVLP